MTDFQETLETYSIPAEDVYVEPYWVEYENTRLYIALYEGSFDDIRSDAANAGISVYYIVGTHIPKVKGNGKDDYKDGPPVTALFKVTDSVLSTSLVKMAEPPVKLFETIGEHAYFKLPKIPWEMVEKLDAFFRKVDKDNGGSEAIVILGFDTRCEDASGWRVIVPEQENNAGHCNYKPESVIDLIPDEDYEHVVQVGTCHSHPNMSAFASHTDEKDQANFDGVHVTFGWQLGNTEFHVEIQAGGVAFNATPEYVFEMPEAKKEYPEFDDWMSRVKKRPNFTGPGAHTRTTTTTTAGDFNPRTVELVKDAPDRVKYQIVATLDPREAKCPVCLNEYTDTEKESRRCLTCMSYFVYRGESLDDLIRVRKASCKPAYELEVEGNAPKDIAIWDNLDPQHVTTDYVTAKNKHAGKALALGTGR